MSRPRSLLVHIAAPAWMRGLALVLQSSSTGRRTVKVAADRLEDIIRMVPKPRRKAEAGRLSRGAVFMGDGHIVGKQLLLVNCFLRPGFQEA